VELKNCMESFVWQALDEVIAGYPDVCACERCRYDIAALALNFLQPRYVVTGRGETMGRIKALEQQSKVDVVCAITNAIIIVKATPHHTRQAD